MKLRNKKTGEIVECSIIPIDDNGYVNESLLFENGDSINELNKNWEDYEESKGTVLDMMIFTLTNFIELEPDEDKVDLEDCKQALEKLKAWKRLKNKGFRFTGVGKTIYDIDCVEFDIGDEYLRERDLRGSELNKDLDLLFGGQ